MLVIYFSTKHSLNDLNYQLTVAVSAVFSRVISRPCKPRLFVPYAEGLVKYRNVDQKSG